MTSVHAASPIPVERLSERFVPQQTRVIMRPFDLGEQRTRRVVERVCALSEEEVRTTLEETIAAFEGRHRHFRETLLRHAEWGLNVAQMREGISDERRLLIGAMFTKEYSISAAAMFNPSIVPAPDQSGCAEGEQRFIMSFRATGEGHLSSIEFRSGTIDQTGDVTLDEVSPYLESAELLPDDRYLRHLVARKLEEMGLGRARSAVLLDYLPEQFTISQLDETVNRLGRAGTAPPGEVVDATRWLCHSNYTIRFNPEHPISERIIFPVSENERRGIEDARFVRFVEEDGSVLYMATYSAYNGVRVLPQMIETTDFVTFHVRTLNGPAARDKGMALFPRKIGGRYYMIGRIDGENLYLLDSDNVHFWHDAELLRRPTYPWEMVQIGNNGSPLETPEGWLLLTHGVGPMRTYSMGCLLLDLDEPRRVIGALNLPLLAPTGAEREGYVPNVVYSCGAMIHGNFVVTPYAVSDSASGIALIPLSALLKRLKGTRT